MTSAAEPRLAPWTGRFPPRAVSRGINDLVGTLLPGCHVTVRGSPSPDEVWMLWTSLAPLEVWRGKAM